MAKELSKKSFSELYREMVLIRRFEEKSAELYAEGKIGGFLHLYIGEEAIAAGACQALRDEDHLLTAYRDHGWAIARGLDPKAVMAELLGKATGVIGRQGRLDAPGQRRAPLLGRPCHRRRPPAARDRASGWRCATTRQNAAVLCVLGEGTTNIGYFHESVNLAAVWKLPVVYLVENNQYGMGTEVGRASAVSDIFQKGCAYDIPNKQFNGQDVFEVYETLDEALELRPRRTARCCWKPSPTATPATRWATPSATAPRPRSRNGGSATRSCACRTR